MHVRLSTLTIILSPDVENVVTFKIKTDTIKNKKGLIAQS